MIGIVERIKLYRANNGLSQEQLARQIGVSLNTVQRWESRRTLPSPLAVMKIDELLGDALREEQRRLI